MQQELDSYLLLGALPPGPCSQVYITASTGLFPQEEEASHPGGAAVLVQGMG